MHVIERARRRLSAFPEVRFDATSRRIVVPAAGPENFTVSLEVAGDREFHVRYDGWHHGFSRAEDAYDCFEFGLSDSCRLRVTLRGETETAWQIEKREYGMWVPGRRIARRWVPFWRRARTVWRQNRIFTTASRPDPT
ncbi:MAG TPA: hypothetical protein VF198_13335 [Vicinamibacterales bacterium]